MISQLTNKFTAIVKYVVVLAFVIICLVSCNDENKRLEAGSKLLQTNIIKGKKYGLFDDGNAYKFNDTTECWELLSKIYDPGFFKKTYEVVNEKVYIKAKSQAKLYPTKNNFEEDFENTNTLNDLIGSRGWTHFQITSPTVRTDQEATQFKKCILRGDCEFKDNRIDIASDIVHSGKKAMRVSTVSPVQGMVTSKASLRTRMICFAKGDDLWFSSWYYAAKGIPFTIVDIENGFFKSAPGPRVIINNGKYVEVELKWADKPKYTQKRGQEIVFPRRKWVNIKVHLMLSDTEDGIIEVWQDGTKIINTKGRTLPTQNSILNRLEVGISASSQSAVLYVDDVSISDKPIIP